MSTVDKAYQAGLALLARREHAELELRHKLLARGFAEAQVDVTVQRLQAAGYQDDERFQELWLRARILRGQGPRRMAAEMRQLGLEAKRLPDLLAHANIDCNELALQVLRKRFKLEDCDSTHRAKQARFLTQRGFDYHHIQYALNHSSDFEERDPFNHEDC